MRRHLGIYQILGSDMINDLPPPLRDDDWGEGSQANADELAKVWAGHWGAKQPAQRSAMRCGGDAGEELPMGNGEYDHTVPLLWRGRRLDVRQARRRHPCPRDAGPTQTPMPSWRSLPRSLGEARL